MKLIKNEINVGIKNPFTVLQVTDTHLVRYSTEDDARKAFCASREGLDTLDELMLAKEYAEKNGCQLVHTGDLLDFITPDGLEIAKTLAKDTGMLFIAGNHEQCYCPENRFCPTDYAEELKVREKTLDHLQKHFENDVRFFRKEINGVILVGIDDGDYQITRAQLCALREVVKEGKPIILFTHIPLYSEELYKVTSDAMLGTPAEGMREYDLWQIYEQAASPTTVEAYDYIVSCPLIKAVVCGHMHFDLDSHLPSGIPQLITDRQTMREITVK